MIHQSLKPLLLDKAALTVALGTLLIAGCHVENSMSANAAPEAPVSLEQKSEAKAEAPVVQDIVVTLTTDKETYKRGETIGFNISARNTGKEPQRLTFMSGQRFDVTATPEGKTESAWRWSADKVFTYDIRVVTIKPGEDKSWKVIWDQNDQNHNAVPRGRYTIIGEITSRNHIQAKPIVLELVD